MPSTASVIAQPAKASRPSAHSEPASMVVHQAEMQRTLQLLRLNPAIADILDVMQKSEPQTYRHSLNVATLMGALASKMRLTSALKFDAIVVGILHDLGKLKIKTEILNKKEGLTPAEFSHIKTHAALGHRLTVPFINISQEVRLGCLQHHEKFDGTGYPNGLAGMEISFLGRMAAICDVYEALTAERPYKQGWNPKDALRHMRENQHQFDGELFQAFEKMMLPIIQTS